jgi:transposase-like protein
MTNPAAANLDTHHRFPGEIISHVVWLYYRYPRHQRAKEKKLSGHGHARAEAPVCVRQQQRLKKGPY